MGKLRKRRRLEEVYNATLEITQPEPEITPVLSGNFPMQGPVPVDEMDREIKMASTQVDQGVGMSGGCQKHEARVGSGTCNMCSAPCSSCFHNRQAIIRSRSEDFSCQDNVFKCLPNVASTVKSRNYESGQHSVSEASIVITVSSSHDSLSENAESKLTQRNIELSSKLSAGVSTTENQGKLKLHKLESYSPENNSKEFRDFEGHDDNISCISGSDGVTTLSGADSRNVEAKSLPPSAASTNSLVSEDYIKALSSEAVQYLQKLDVDGSEFFTRSKFNDITTQKVRPIGSFPDHLHNSRLLRNNLLEDIDDAAGSDIRLSVVGVNPKPEMEKCVKLEASDGAITAGLATEALSSLQHIQEVEKVRELHALPVAKETSMQSVPTKALNSTEQNHVNNDFDILEHDRVCDTCGDIGREYLLVLCCRCSDGAEHTYCMSNMLDKIPEGGWLCQECKMEEGKSQENDNCDEVGGVTHQFSVRVNAKNSHRCDKSGGRVTHSKTSKTSEDSSYVKVPRKRNEDTVGVSSTAKELALEPTVRSIKNFIQDRVGLHHRSSSVKNIDRGDSKPVRKPHSVGHMFADTKGTEAPTLGTLSKSNSFSTISTKRKPKLVNEVFRKQKSMHNPDLPSRKEGSSRVMGKSLSSKSLDSNRLRDDESKAKMLSPNLCHSRDLAGFKHAKEQNFAKRKSSFEYEHSVASPTIDKESSNLAEKVKGSSFSCRRQHSTTETKSDSYKKCGVEKLLAPDVLTARNLKVVKNKCKKLKAEIEVTQLKKTGSYRNDKILGVSTLNSKFEVSSHNQLSSSSNPRNLVADDKVSKEGLATAWNLNANSTKQPSATSAEAVNLRIVDSLPSLSIDQIPNLMDLPNKAFKENSSHLTNTAFPEYEYIWQGCFEVHKGGKLPDIYDGFQAHLSTCASPKVIETMNTFPQKVLLNEVQRLSTWPIQFVETGVREAHIGLYFFARDYGSYVKFYKNMVERMMKNDLALKGDIDGAEILIFPSNQLPEKSQRWNMMFFLWGVFKEKRFDCQQQGNGCWIPKAIMSSPESILSLVPIDKEEPVSYMSDALADSPHLLTAGISCGTDSSPAFEKVICSNLTVEQTEYMLECNLLSNIPKCLPQSWPEVRSTLTGKTVGIAGSLFPEDPFAAKNALVVDTSILSNGEELRQERAPNLELALGTEVIPAKEIRQDQALGREATEAEEDVPAELSLSLSFPFTDEDHCTTSFVKGTAHARRGSC